MNTDSKQVKFLDDSQTTYLNKQWADNFSKQIGEATTPT